MSIAEQDRGIVQGVFDAMQMGPMGEEKMMALFAEDSTLVEPFNGEPQTSVGKPAIRARFVEMWSGEGPHDLDLKVEQIDAVDGKVRVEWTCRSASFLTPMAGVDHFTIDQGLIKELTMEVTTWPEFAGGGAHA